MILPEENNPTDKYAIAVQQLVQASESGELQDKWLTVGHMPIELSRQIYFFLKCGGSVQATVLDIALHRSPVTLKGLEIHLNTRFSISVDKITI